MQHSKIYDSFQDELEDYIKVQKARGLEPKTCLRKMREDYLGTFGYKEVDSRPRYRMSDQRHPYETVQAYYPRPYNIPQTLEYPLPQKLPAFDSRMKLDPSSYYKLSRDCSSGKPVPLNLSQQDYHCGSYTGESDIYKHLSENSTTAHQTSHREMHQKRKKHHVKDREKQEEERPKHKKKKSCEETDSDKQKNIQGKQTEVETANVSAEKLKTRKEKNHREVSSKKEERKRKKEKKTQGQEKTDEEMLWDQSILGF